jgi:hypothetical protein
VDESRLVIAVDYDGVIADTNSAKAHWLRQHLGIDVDPGDCSHTDLVPDVLDEAQYRSPDDYVYSESVSADVPPVRGAVEALRRLSERWQIVVLSARSAERLKWAGRWLQRRGLTEAIEDVRTSDGQSKEDALNELEALVLVDDDRRHLTGLSPDGPVGILFGSRPHPGEGLVQVDSWPAVERLLSLTYPRVGPRERRPEH